MNHQNQYICSSCLTMIMIMYLRLLLCNPLCFIPGLGSWSPQLPKRRSFHLQNAKGVAGKNLQEATHPPPERDQSVHRWLWGLNVQTYSKGEVLHLLMHVELRITSRDYPHRRPPERLRGRGKALSTLPKGVGYIQSLLCIAVGASTSTLKNIRGLM